MLIVPSPCFLFCLLQVVNGEGDNEVALDDLPTKLTGLTEVSKMDIQSLVKLGTIGDKSGRDTSS